MGTGVLKLSTTCPAVLKPVFIDVFLPLSVSSDYSPLKYIKKIKDSANKKIHF